MNIAAQIQQFGQQVKDTWKPAPAATPSAPATFDSAWGMLGGLGDLWGGTEAAQPQSAGLSQAQIDDILRGDPGESGCQRQWSAPSAFDTEDILRGDPGELYETLY